MGMLPILVRVAFLFVCFFIVETGTHCVVLAGHKLTM